MPSMAGMLAIGAGGRARSHCGNRFQGDFSPPGRGAAPGVAPPQRRLGPGRKSARREGPQPTRVLVRGTLHRGVVLESL